MRASFLYAMGFVFVILGIWGSLIPPSPNPRFEWWGGAYAFCQYGGCWLYNGFAFSALTVVFFYGGFALIFLAFYWNYTHPLAWSSHRMRSL